MNDLFLVSMTVLDLERNLACDFQLSFLFLLVYAMLMKLLSNPQLL